MLANGGDAQFNARVRIAFLERACMKMSTIFVTGICSLNVLLSGCFDHALVKGYDGPDIEARRLATIEINGNCYLEVDGAAIELPKLGLNDVHVQIKPGIRDVGWTLDPFFWGFDFSMGGTFKAEAGRIYKVQMRWLEKSWTEAADYATWLADAETKEVVIGRKPDWVDDKKSKGVSF
jgi:hypothetical protein